MSVPAVPLVPEYGKSTLSDVFGSIASSLGHAGWVNALALPSAKRWVLVLVDGLGDINLAAALEHAPFLAAARQANSARTITSAAPSTTATSITSLGTGLPPGQHGIVGYAFRNPVSNGKLNALLWERGLSALDVQPRLTGFERLARTDTALTLVNPARFQGSGLTECAMRGARFQPVPDERDYAARIGWVVDAAVSAPSTFTYFYERELDHGGHAHGWQSHQWRTILGRVDHLLRRLREALPDDVQMLITGDHGMMDIPRERWVIAEDVPGLLDSVAMVAGEGRFRQFYVDPGSVSAVIDRWQKELGERAWVCSREEAVAAGWFGPTDARIAPRIGDVCIAMREDWAVMTRSEPKELGLLGMHGSLTEQEMRVPLLVG
ncbi:MAG: alkaline phosphatase family protein [Propioniciclava sp.]